MSVSEPIRISYLVTCDSDHIRARAEALLLEQTVELPLNARSRPAVAQYIGGQVEHIEPVADHAFRVVIAQPLAAAAGDPAQLLNLLFGNSSLQPDLVLEAVVLPDEALTFLSGPRYGIAGTARPQRSSRPATARHRAQADGPGTRGARRSGPPVRSWRPRPGEG
jgi:ribulose-bisphosphate carboxylase large chain